MASTPTQRNIQKHVTTEMRWLQRVLFGLGKIRMAREKLAEARGEPLAPLTVETSEGTVTFAALEDALRQRSDSLQESAEKGRRRLLVGFEGSRA